MTNMFQTDSVDDTVIQAIREKYKDNPDEAWKALAHSQKHISTLEAERQEAKQNDVLAEVLEYIKGTKNSQAPLTNQSTVVTDPVKDETALEQKFLAMLDRQKAKDAEDRNRELVRQTMVEKYKDKAGDEFGKLAQSIGMNTKDLENLSVSNPQAFFKLAGLEPSRSNSQPTKSTVNPQAMQAASGTKGRPGTQSWWDNYFAENPTKRLDPKLHAQKLVDWEKDPDYFENN